MGRVSLRPLRPEGSLPEVEIRRAEADGVRASSARRNGEIHAMVGTCAHMSPPLAEGTLIDDSAPCLWRGSVYAPEDGSARKQAIFFNAPSPSCIMRRSHKILVLWRLIGKGCADYKDALPLL